MLFNRKICCIFISSILPVFKQLFLKYISPISNGLFAERISEEKIYSQYCVHYDDEYYQDCL